MDDEDSNADGSKRKALNVVVLLSEKVTENFTLCRSALSPLLLFFPFSKKRGKKKKVEPREI